MNRYITRYIFSGLLFIVVLLYGIKPVFASNFTYKVYDPQTNKAYTAVLGTVSITDDKYFWGFYTQNGEPLCVAQIYKTNKKDGLVGGQCTDINAFFKFLAKENIDLSKYEMSWREFSQNTLYTEMNDIREERALQGKYEYTDSSQEIPNIQEANLPSVEVPIRENAFVIVLQPVPDNSGDYTITICNKRSSCRQTSLLESEIRYIGLFLEDTKSDIAEELNKKLTSDEWLQRQDVFRKVYADYMNMYDSIYGPLNVVPSKEIKKLINN